MRNLASLGAILLLVLALAGPALADAAADYERGVRAYDLRQYPAAVRAFEAAVRKAPKEALYHLWLGMARFHAGQVEAARTALETAARLGAGTAVGESAKKNLAALPAASATPTAAASPGAAAARLTPTGWKRLGAVEGLLGEDWYGRDTTSCRVWAREGDLRYLEEVVGTLDAAYAANAAFMGFSARPPLNFYFFSLDAPAHTQPKFSRRLSGRTRFMGVALSGDTCVVNLGNWRNARHYEPWDVAQTSCHEMNHMFLSQIGLQDRGGDWSWLAEALAEAVEDRVLPRARWRTLDTAKVAMRGYRSPDASWRAMVADRNDDSLESYRDYGPILASIVYFMQSRYGADAVPKLLQAARGGTLQDAFGKVFGKGSDELFVEWKDFYGID